MGTYFQTKEEARSASRWLIVDAAGIPVGRLASEVAAIIRGKNHPEFTKHVDGGDFVIVVNAAKAVFTGKKLSDKVYYHHTGFPGGIKGITAGTMMEKNPERVVHAAVKGMLPKGALGHQMITKLKVYVGEDHPHAAQMPEPYELKYARRVS